MTVKIRKRSSISMPRVPVVTKTKQEPTVDVVPSAPSTVESKQQTVITILTGNRPMLLRKTLQSLASRAPELIAQARVVALANGSDAPTLDILKKSGWVKDILQTDTLLPIGEAFSFLMKNSLGSSRYVFHLEDDWDCCGMENEWWGRAVHCIENERVGQVRLRYAKDRSMSMNALTHQTIRWEKRDDYVQVSKNAHFTFNPSLVPVTVMQGLYPCGSELDAMAKFSALSLKVARVLPGAFIHSGTGNKSLAEQTGGR
jgi:hypothetical protein